MESRYTIKNPQAGFDGWMVRFRWMGASGCIVAIILLLIHLTLYGYVAAAFSLVGMFLGAIPYLRTVLFIDLTSHFGGKAKLAEVKEAAETVLSSCSQVRKHSVLVGAGRESQTAQLANHVATIERSLRQLLLEVERRHEQAETDMARPFGPLVGCLRVRRSFAGQFRHGECPKGQKIEPSLAISTLVYSTRYLHTIVASALKAYADAEAVPDVFDRTDETLALLRRLSALGVSPDYVLDDPFCIGVGNQLQEALNYEYGDPVRYAKQVALALQEADGIEGPLRVIADVLEEIDGLVERAGPDNAEVLEHYRVTLECTRILLSCGQGEAEIHATVLAHLKDGLVILDPARRLPRLQDRYRVLRVEVSQAISALQPLPHLVLSSSSRDTIQKNIAALEVEAAFGEDDEDHLGDLTWLSGRIDHLQEVTRKVRLAARYHSMCTGIEAACPFLDPEVWEALQQDGALPADILARRAGNNYATAMEHAEALKEAIAAP